MRALALVCVMVLALGGCAFFGSDSCSEDMPQAQEAAATAAPEKEAENAISEEKAPAKKDVQKKVKKGKEKVSKKKGQKSEEQIAAELDITGRKLAAQAGRTLMPSKASKAVRREGSSYVATYVEVDTSNVRTEMRPGAAPGQYVGFVRYQEKFMECRGASKKAALANASCQHVKTRNLNELIRYDGSSWKY